MIEFIGQWSMLDVFVVVLMGAMANFRAFLSYRRACCCKVFGLVVVLTMLATLSFDPRVGWDQRVQTYQTPIEPLPFFNRLGK